MQRTRIATSINMPAEMRERLDRLQARSAGLGGVRLSLHRLTLLAVERGLDALECAEPHAKAA